MILPLSLRSWLADCIQPALFAALRTAIDLNLFAKLVEPDQSPKSITELAEATDSDPKLLGLLPLCTPKTRY